jgi:hypothetical protein
MRHPKLEKIIELLENGEDFSLTRMQYIDLTGIDTPQDKHYTEKKSSVAKKASEYGFTITVVPEILKFVKQ